MLNNQELAIVVDTLSKRRAWLLKQNSNVSMSAVQRDECKSSAAILDGAISKLNSQSSKPKSTKSTNSSKSGLNPKLEAFYAHADKPGLNTAGGPASIELNKLRVLIAEDDVDSARLLKDVQKDMGVVEMDLAADGEEAVTKFQNANPAYNLLLCDWNMPKMTGLEVHQAIREKAKAENTRFILVTAVNDAERIRTAIKQGISDYIVKPIDIDIVEEKIKSTSQPQ